jgi:hypothetical protein
MSNNIRPVVFLDIDGVLNSHDANPATKYNRIHEKLAKRFNDWIEENDYHFVVSSAWRYLVHGGSMTLEGFANLFHGHGINGHRMVGITDKDASPCEPRSDQVLRWLYHNRAIHERTIRPYVVLDDLDLGFTGARMPFVKTDGTYGVSTINLACAGDMIFRQIQEDQ